MDGSKKVKEKFVTSIWFEIATFVGLFVVERVLQYTNRMVELKLGPASSQGYGWGLILGGTLYLLLIAVIVTGCILGIFEVL